jgi:competence ComEA-like helix-hairpin-helix protein
MNPSEPTPNTSEPILSHPLAVEETPVDPAPPAESPPAEAPSVEAAIVEPPKPERPSQPVPPVPPAPQPHDLSRIAQDLQIRKGQVEAVVRLLDDENTVPFITRYRKEATGGLNEEAIRRIQERLKQLRQLADRKQTILKSIAYQGKLTEDLTQAILAADFPKRLEDLYLPFKPKKKSKATEAREKGLAPLAEAIWVRDPAVANLDEVLPGLVDPDKWLLNTDEVLAGVKEILAEMVSDAAEVRGPLRNFIWDVGLIASNKVETLPEGKGKEFDPYASFKEPVREIPPHRVLAINRGEKTNILRVHLDIDRNIANEIVQFHLNLADHPHRDLMTAVAADSLERLVLPSLEREVRRELTERAQDHAVMVFARNLRSLLLQPPLRAKKVLAVDPGIRTGCKLAVLDETGKLLEDAVIYPHGQRKNAADSKRKLEQLVRKHAVEIIAIGNGTGCRETEQLVADLIGDLENRRLNPTVHVPSTPPAPPAAEVPTIATPDAVTHTEAPTPALPEGTFVSEVMPVGGMSFTSDVHVPPPETTGVETTGTSAPASETVTTGSGVVPVPPPPAPEISLEGLPDASPELAYVIVIEAGASDYSASPVAREEFPNLDATTRGTISIGRRLQDPLAELVKIDPQHIGVGLYQHDVKPKHLKESLEGVIESSVNQVGVDLNTASVPLLRHVSGMNQLVARAVVEHRERHGAFTSREQLQQVAGLGEKRYAQAAGFLKIPDSPDPLDTTWIHPESYATARQILTDLGFEPAHLRDHAKLEELRARLRDTSAAEAANVLKVGEPTIRDIFEALARPGRDPREDVPPPIFKKGVLKIEDINPGMELKGTVLNVVPFGAFVDIGLKESGLVHISQMANRYIKSPYDVVAVGDVVAVWVIEVKGTEKKISLSMIQPGQERRPQERQEREPRPPREPREPRRDRGPGPGGPPRGERQGQGGPRRGDRSGPPPRGDRPQHQPAGPVDLPPPPPPRPVRPPRPPKPLPKLTGDKKTGKAALNTFAELAAFFKKDEPEKPPEPPKVEEPKAEEPKPDEPKAE